MSIRTILMLEPHREILVGGVDEHLQVTPEENAYSVPKPTTLVLHMVIATINVVLCASRLSNSVKAFGWVFTLSLSLFISKGLSATTASLHHHHHHNMAMYVRVKRKKTTYFVHCEPSDTTLQVKNKLQALTDSPTKNQRLILMDSHHVLDDGRTLAQQHVENNSIIALTLKKSSGEWEDIDIDKFNNHNVYDSESSS
ncbi:hypothetical protein GOP47_0003805 [Adiantum capillus-veneris]|uniref:Ubiquitin-like domain-containing protein n=1 Tax=Adiantum capillus-veneris TaxID=13818 RepID=A0A9D4V804_ADICA|nr:hypothetical protein GOP47_0003805 [Adiantum capillus-veneris]